jgi:hypothetical protein
MKLVINKLFPLIILLFVIIGCTKLAWTPEEIREQRKKVIEVLNAKYDLSHNATIDQTIKGIRYDCQFRFFQSLEDNKVTLEVYFCESTSSAMKERKLADVLTPDNFNMIKNAKFEQVKLYERINSKLVDTVAIQSSEY